MTANPGMSSWEFVYWIAYNNLDPFGNDREDLRMGILASSAVNVHLKNGRTRPSDFIPEFGKPRVKDWREVKAWFLQLKLKQEQEAAGK